MENTLLIPGLEGQKASPDFTRLRDAILRQGRSDRLPFLELFADREIVEAVIGRPWVSDADKIEFCYRLGYDSVGLHTGFRFNTPRRMAENTAEMANGERSWISDDICPIRTREDLEHYAWPDPGLVSTEGLARTAADLPAGMGIVVNCSGVLENVMWLMGYAALAEALYDDPDLVQDMFDAVGSRILRVIESMADCPEVGGIFFGEDMGFKTATMIAPDDLRKYHFPHLKRMVDAAHARGKFFVLHSCGNLEQVMDDLIDGVGIDAKHSFEDAIQPVAEFKRAYGHRVGVVGGVDIDALARMDTESLRVYVRRVLDECAPGGGYTLGTGNSVTNYVKLENYLAMLEEGWRYREAHS